MQVTAEDIARRLGAARKAGDDWSCKCPAHEDNKASLSIKDGQNGKILVHCHAGCHQDDVVNQIKLIDMWPTVEKRKYEPPKVVINLVSPSAPGKGTIAATYDYVDEHGELLYQAVRYEPKDFRQRRPLPEGGWSWSIKGVRRVLYRLPEVLEAVAKGEDIFICEGEKDVEAARAIGLVATCNAMGADNGAGNKWMSEFGAIFKGANVIVVPDQDEAGKRHADWVLSTLDGHAKNLGIANPKVGKDLSDWLASGITKDDIFRATEDYSDHSGEKYSTHSRLLDISELIIDIKPINWIVRDYVENDSLALIYGAPGSGKSFFTVDLACSIATGHEWMGHKVTQGGVFYIAGEGHNGLARRFKGWEESHATKIKPGQIFKSAGATQMMSEDHITELSEDIYQTSEQTGQKPSAIIFDTVARNFGQGDENSTQDMSRVIALVDEHIRQRFQCLVVFVHHSGHNAERARGSSALKAAVDSEYEVTKDESGNVTIRGTKMKDAELPPELVLKLKSVELPGVFDEDGEAVTSAYLGTPDDLIHSKVAETTDGKKILASDVLNVLQADWLSNKKLGMALGLTQASAQRAVKALVSYGFIAMAGSGRAREGRVTTEGLQALSRTGNKLTEQHKPAWKRTAA